MSATPGTDSHDDHSTYAEDLLQGGDQEHLGHMVGLAREQMAHIAMALDLLAGPLAHAPIETDDPAPNELAALACLASAFRGIRAATLLALSGYTTEARTVNRRTYETAALARMLAHEPGLAEKWLQKGSWFPDAKVRAWFGVQAAPEEEKTGYQAFYRFASSFAHPTVRSALPLLLQTDSAGCLDLNTAPPTDDSTAVMKEIAAEAVFVCFALRNAAVSPDILPPAWHARLADLARAVGADVADYDEDADTTEALYESLLAAVLPAEQLDEYLRQHPNSYDNVRKRAEETR